MKPLKEISIALAIFALGLPLMAQSPTSYQYFTNSERYNDTLRIPFSPPQDTIYGRIHSNDTFLFRSGFTVTQIMSSAQDIYLVENGGEINDPDHLLTLGVDSIPLLRNTQAIRSAAQPFISDMNGRLMTLIELMGTNGFKIYQYRLGSDRTRITEDNLYGTYNTPNWQSIFVDGQVEIRGEMAGSLTIGSSGNMWLIDDIRYVGAYPFNGNFDEASMSHILGLVSEQNIIIEDNYRNGKAGGWRGGVDPHPAEPNNWNRHSIVITASLMALAGSVTFEHQNNDWDGYQGTTPDERGFVFLKGSIAENRRGLLHRSNHEGTGYGKAYRGDFRFDRRPPPYFPGYPYIPINREVLGDGGHNIGWEQYRVLIMEPGANVDILGGIEVFDSLIIRGTEQNPVRLNARSNWSRIQAINYRQPTFVSINNCNVGEVLLQTLSNPAISYSQFEKAPELSGDVTLDHCTFDSDDDHCWTGNFSVSYSSFRNAGIILTGRDSRLNLTNCTIAGGNGTGLSVLDRATATITNSIIAFSRNGVYCDNRSTISVRYCDFFGAVIDNIYGFEAGEGTISADPLLIDIRSGDFNLEAESPCIDSGDPDSPLDPDGSRADIGAFAFDHRLAVDDDDSPSVHGEGEEGGLVASPNPFNSSTVLTFQSAESAKSAVALKIYSLSGQVVASFTLTPAHPHTLTLDAPAGLYIARLENGLETHSIKLVKVN